MRVIEGSSAAPSGVAVKGHSRMGLSRVFDEVSVRIVSLRRRRRVFGARVARLLTMVILIAGHCDRSRWVYERELCFVSRVASAGV